MPPAMATAKKPRQPRAARVVPPTRRMTRRMKTLRRLMPRQSNPQRRAAGRPRLRLPARMARR